MAKDRFGNEIEEERKATVFDAQGKLNPPEHKALGMGEVMSGAQPGAKVTPFNRPVEQGEQYAFIESSNPQEAAASHAKRMGEMGDFMRNSPELQYQRDSAARLKVPGRIDALKREGVNPDVAAQLTMADVMAGRKSERTPEQFISTKSGVFSTTERGIVEGTEVQPKAPLQTMGPNGPAVRHGEMVGFWDPKLNDYSGWKMPTAGEEIRDPSTGKVIFSRGGGDYSSLPKYGSDPAAASGEGEDNPLDAAGATAFLEQAGGDPNQARELARQAGYTF